MTKASRRAEALALLGLARRAGAVVKGTEGTRQALRKGEARLVILAEDGSEVQRRKVEPLAGAREVPCLVFGQRLELGAALGCGPVTALAVTGPGFARELREKLGRE